MHLSLTSIMEWSCYEIEPLPKLQNGMKMYALQGPEIRKSKEETKEFLYDARLGPERPNLVKKEISTNGLGNRGTIMLPLYSHT